MKTFVVLGMHRSATSLVAKGLEENGVQMGRALLGAVDSNPFGHFENVQFVSLNDAILSEAGGSWDAPPPGDAIIEAGRRMASVIYATVKANERAPLWGWKDPRTTLTIRCYLPYLVNPHFITCFRDPAAVAASLNARDGMPVDFGLWLAGEYNRRLLTFLSEWSGNGASGTANLLRVDKGSFSASIH